MRKYCLSTEAFRQRFHNATKSVNELYLEFAYNLRANLVEWLKSTEAFGDHKKVIECIALEQFFQCLPLHYSYLFLNKSDQLLRDQGQCFSSEIVQVLTWSKERQLASQLTYDGGEVASEQASGDVTTAQMLALRVITQKGVVSAALMNVNLFLAMVAVRIRTSLFCHPR